MASEEESTSDSVSVRQVPAHLLNYLRSRILHYVAEASEFSAEIHHVSEQAARLVFSMETKPKQNGAETSNIQDDNESATIILVQNFPSLLDEEVLELFFESTKKKGGGPVRSVKLNTEKNWAIVEFFEPEAVKTVMSKRPIKLLGATLDIQAYTPLLQGDKQVKSLDIRGLPNDLTDDILATHLDSMIDPSTVSARNNQVAVDALKIKETTKRTLSDINPLQLKLLLTSDGVSVRQVPTHLLNYLRSRILHYVAKASELSAEIQHISGQPARLVLSMETKSDLKDVQDDNESTDKIVVQNIPSLLDEEFLELFFESRKKKGGGPVKSLKLNREKNWAIIEFYEPEAVQIIMNKKPIQMLGATLDIQPYTPLLQCDETIESLDVKGLPIELTEEILAAHFESMIISSTAGTDQVAGDSLNVKDNVIEAISFIDTLKLRMLEISKFQEQLIETFPNLKVTINRSKTEVTFECDETTIRSAKIQMYEKLNNFAIRLLDNISQNHLDLFLSKQTTDYISKTLRTMKSVGVWEVRASKLVICSFDKDLSSCVDIVTQSVKEVKLDVPKHLAILFSLKSRHWQAKVAAIHAKYNGLCRVCPSEYQSKIYVVATDDVVGEIEGECQAYLKQHTIVTISLKVQSRHHYDKKVDEIAVNEMVADIAKRLTQHSVTILQVEHVRWFEYEVQASGTAEGIQLFKERMKEVMVMTRHKILM